ncbi:S1 family peptidase [Thalassotalea agarivorans]|uniref:Serine protease, S1-C subfamily, contains C-terminal PDZ domain n=1 Tax=Thalassotalea agarivorans TaxID=349064 RepID=A0A1I0CDU0_THASX|nr:serine protease [Thalassotalea agarivorans]SET17753.1 serine protease, S1-C subfamily, contains C-terminal PDZ domain [Thalassotalea agarivorans]
MRGIIVWLSLLVTFTSVAQEQAKEIFKELAPSLFQIKIIDKASGEKSSIGSGFQISAQGLIATNYHVISSFARHPEKYTMEYLDHNGDTGELSLLSVDIINDLALVKREIENDAPYFVIANNTPVKGEEIYSLGNPHDLGMIVVPGTYNGLKKESFNDKIHFTGSVNPGMSGGPVVNRDKEVVGINVATAGNQIGFLIPHQKLVALVDDYQENGETTDINVQMTAQLKQNQQKLIDALLEAEWEPRLLDNSGIFPLVKAPFIRCWGDSNSDEEKLVNWAAASCMLEEDVYIDQQFNTGTVELDFRLYRGNDISASKFYNLYENSLTFRSGNDVSKDDSTEFKCQHNIVDNGEQSFTSKTVFCTRAYKDFKGLFDVMFVAFSVDKNDKALISHFTLAGVEQAPALKFTRKFMESVSWN